MAGVAACAKHGRPSNQNLAELLVNDVINGSSPPDESKRDTYVKEENDFYEINSTEDTVRSSDMNDQPYDLRIRRPSGSTQECERNDESFTETSHQNKLERESQDREGRFTSYVLENMNQLRHRRLLCDVIFQVEGQVQCIEFSTSFQFTENWKNIQAHKVVMASCSSFCRNVFLQEGSSEKLHGNVDIFPLNEVTEIGFRNLLEFVYTGRICLSDDVASNVLEAAKLMKIKELVKKCSSYIESTMANCSQAVTSSNKPTFMEINQIVSDYSEHVTSPREAIHKRRIEHFHSSESDDVTDEIRDNLKQRKISAKSPPEAYQYSNLQNAPDFTRVTNRTSPLINGNIPHPTSNANHQTHLKKYEYIARRNGDFTDTRKNEDSDSFRKSTVSSHNRKTSSNSRFSCEKPDNYEAILGLSPFILGSAVPPITQDMRMIKPLTGFASTAFNGNGVLNQSIWSNIIRDRIQPTNYNVPLHHETFYPGLLHFGIDRPHQQFLHKRHMPNDYANKPDDHKTMSGMNGECVTSYPVHSGADASDRKEVTTNGKHDSTACRGALVGLAAEAPDEGDNPSNSNKEKSLVKNNDAKNSTRNKLTFRNTDAVKPYNCPLCDANFNRPANLKTHMRIHSGEKPYKCDTCGASFVQVAHLRAHALIHTGQKPYPCNVCGTSFRHLQTLKSHLRIHTGEKPYSCERCSVRFRHKSQLRLHLRTRHDIQTNTKKTYKQVPGLCSADISAHIKRVQEAARSQFYSKPHLSSGYHFPGSDDVTLEENHNQENVSTLTNHMTTPPTDSPNS